ncbi:N-terminal acetyltransferase [Podila verticillata]|nr:N-terminal acetyltransferase [Podila verticillata]
MAVQESESYTEEQIFAILRRIKYSLKNPNVLPELTLDTLRELQYRCVTSIPFETLSLRTTKSPGVDTTAQGVYDRVVNQRRGGSDPVVAGGLTHRLSIVRFVDETRHAFDVGFGNTHFFTIELRDGAEIDEQQYYEPDCVIANFYSAYSPSSPFIGLFRAVQATLDGKYYILLNTEFKIRSAKGTDSMEPTETEQQRQDILNKYFDIVLTEEEWLYHDQKKDRA